MCGIRMIGVVWEVLLAALGSCQFIYEYIGCFDFVFVLDF
jgi:hypothetical protein